jgi:L-lactate dehydrogenase complex protein LldG
MTRDQRMNANREQMLQRIREAVTAGNRAGGMAPLPERGGIGYQGAGGDVAARFRDEFAAAGGHPHLVADRDAARSLLVDLLRARSIRRVFAGQDNVLAALGVGESLRAEGFEVVLAGTPEAERRETIFQAEAGVSGVDYLIAETGSVILASRPEQPRALSLLPPLHVAIAERAQLLPDLFDLFAVRGTNQQEVPACLSIVTGPSKTGDIELRLVTGVHGPGEIHVILIDSPETAAGR